MWYVYISLIIVLALHETTATNLGILMENNEPQGIKINKLNRDTQYNIVRLVMTRNNVLQKYIEMNEWKFEIVAKECNSTESLISIKEATERKVIQIEICSYLIVYSETKHGNSPAHRVNKTNHRGTAKYRYMEEM